VQVARLAGLPESVVARARDVLERLEAGAREGAGAAQALAQELPLFAARPASPASPLKRGSAIEERLREVHPDTLSPRDALTVLYELKEMLAER
jgi:DNA mismatch repair protein MutS